MNNSLKFMIKVLFHKKLTVYPMFPDYIVEFY